MKRPTVEERFTSNNIEDSIRAFSARIVYDRSILGLSRGLVVDTVTNVSARDSRLAQVTALQLCAQPEPVPPKPICPRPTPGTWDTRSFEQTTACGFRRSLVCVRTVRARMCI